VGSVDMNDISLQTLKTTQQERKNEPKTKDVSFGKTKGRTRQTEQYSSLGSEIEGTKSPHIFPISTRVINSEKKRKTNLRTHNYLTRINDEQWTDLQRIKDLDNRSFNSLINEGVRLVVKNKLQELSTLRKSRTTLENMVSV